MESKMDVKFKSVHILIALVLVLSGCGSNDKSAPLDTDGDGVPDSTDIFPRDASETTDTDGDGIGDNGDNCPAIVNTDQLNTDNDQLGNICDDDDDGDGVNDAEDIFPLDATEQVDIDEDGLGDNKDLDLDRTQKNSASIERLIEEGRAIRIIAPQAIDQSSVSSEIGDAISNAGDVNNDGFDDLLIGFGQYEKNDTILGICYLIFGRESGFPSEIPLAQLEQSDLEYVVFQADENETDSLGIGTSVSALGDINGDDIDDFAIGVPFVDNDLDEKSGGEAYIVFGRDTWPDKNITISELKSTYAVGFKGQQKFGLLGQSIINAGDLNNDGKPDLLISEYKYDVGMVEDAGRVHIIFGGDHLSPPVNNQISLRNIDDVPSTIHTVLNGVGTFSVSGTNTNAIGDFNQDQIADIAIRSQDYGAKTKNGADGIGAVSIVFGRTNWPAEINLADLTGVDGFNIFGDGPGLQFGKALASGDFNNDQVPDVIIGAPDHTSSTRSEPNKVYMLWGGSGPWPASITSSQIETTYGNTITSDSDIGLGVSLDVLNDTNGDGQPELMIVSDAVDRGSEYEQTPDESARLFKLNSRSSWNDVVLTYTDLPAEVDRIGSVLTHQAFYTKALGDYNGDGIQDMLFDFSTGYKREDRLDEAYIIYGYQNLIIETKAE
jgi:hypothetical protein